MMHTVSQKFFLFYLFLFFLTPFILLAQSSSENSFSIRQQIGVNTTPPTTPAFITATPVATTQIDVAWGSSTDDVSLAGYRLRRDGVHIATTTLTTYSDTGLSPSTTYSYVVEAYDWIGNLSTSAGPVATTTYQVVVPTTSTTTSSTVGGNIYPRVVTFEVDPTTSGAIFTWSTNIYTNYILRWGLGSKYELGFVQSDTYKHNHSTQIGGLQPGTTYQFELVGYNQRGEMFVLEQGPFTTNVFPDVTAPANVSNMQVVVEGVSAYLSWSNPIDSDFAKVRVVRNHLFYPQNSLDGFIAYEGSAESLLDSGVLSDHGAQYYTIFSYDTLGNVSSGAIGIAQKGEGGLNHNPDDNLSDGKMSSSSDAFISNQISFDDVVFIQDGLILRHEDRNVVVRDDMPTTITLAANLLPRHLKTITVTMRNGKGVEQSYILRANKTRTAYETRITSVAEGTYTAIFSIYNFKLQTETIFNGEVISARYNNGFDLDTPAVFSGTTGDFFTLYEVFPTALLFLFFFWWYFFILRRTREDN